MSSTVQRHVLKLSYISFTSPNLKRVLFSSCMKSCLRQRKYFTTDVCFKRKIKCAYFGNQNYTYPSIIDSGSINNVPQVIQKSNVCFESFRILPFARAYTTSSKQPQDDKGIGKTIQDEKCTADGKDDMSLEQETETPPKLTLYQRFKQMYKEYWYVLVPVHIATSAVWFGGFYYLAVSGVDVVHLLSVIGVPDSWIEPLRSSKAGGIVSAYTMYKIATPARYTVTLGGTTISINYLKKWGWIKPMPSKEKLKEMYHEKKAVYQDKIQERKDDLKRTVQETKEEFRKTTDGMKQNYLEAKEGFQKSVTETKVGFKQGMSEATQEWKHVGSLFLKGITNLVKKKNK